jgi:uncharacterized OB-fold protein
MAPPTAPPTAPKERKYPAPEPNPETKRFWEAAAQGQLLVKKCLSCGEIHYYPRALCPFCGSDRTDWQTASGRGTVYSWSVMRRAETPYAIAYVTLDEGVTMMTNIVDCDLNGIRIGQKVRVVWKPTEGGPPLPAFTPA